MGLFSKLFGSKTADAEPAAPTPIAPERVVKAAVVLRQGMRVPDPQYVAQVIAAAGLPAEVASLGLSQPTWFKNRELAESAALDAAQAFCTKLGIEETAHKHRTVAGPDGAKVMLVEIFLD